MRRTCQARFPIWISCPFPNFRENVSRAENGNQYSHYPPLGWKWQYWFPFSALLGAIIIPAEQFSGKWLLARQIIEITGLLSEFCLACKNCFYFSSDYNTFEYILFTTVHPRWSICTVVSATQKWSITVWIIVTITHTTDAWGCRVAEGPIGAVGI